VFTTTIRENLLLARRSATEPELWDALAAVALDSWVSPPPESPFAVATDPGP
jgi:ABC-type transport system involved in cytochrome bd biosynthesis fused ATPase/permease subunit